MLTFTHSIQARYVEIRFSAKPEADVRTMLKANGFRWSPSSGVWWRSTVAGAADFLAALDRKLHPSRPDGECWCCQSPHGFFRRQGPATPVYCEACWQAVLREDKARAERQRHREDPLGVDMAYEDACQRACGL